MPTFTRGIFEGERDQVLIGSGSTRATIIGWIDAADPVVAATAANLPRIGDGLSAAAPTVTLRNITITEYAGGQALGRGAFPGQANSGICLVRLEYDSAQEWQTTPKPVAPGESFSQIELGSSSATVYFGEDQSGGGSTTAIENLSASQLAGPLNGGDGVNIDLPQLSVSVVKSYAANANLNVTGWVNAAGTLNQGNTTLPPLYGKGQSWSFAKGQLLYVGPQIQTQGDLIVVTHQFRAAPTHFETIQERGPDGKIAVTRKVRVRNYADHGAIIA